jgi:hypothetical protein
VRVYRGIGNLFQYPDLQHLSVLHFGDRVAAQPGGRLCPFVRRGLLLKKTKDKSEVFIAS